MKTPTFPRFLTFLGLTLAPWAGARIQDGLISYLEFEVEATTAAVTAGPDGLLQSGATAGAPGGLRGNALLLDASAGNQHVLLPLAFGPGTDLGQDFTISAWYKLNDLPAENGSSRYFVFESDLNFEVSYGLRNLGLGEPGINDGQVFTGGGGSIGVPDAGISGWQHVLATYAVEGDTMTVRTFINGSEIQSLTSGALSFAASGFHFGAARAGADNRGFDGLMDEVAVWDRPLTEGEIYEVYLRGEAGEALTSSDPADPAPEIVFFEATPATVERGGEVTLSWEVTGSNSVWISGLGLVDAQSSEMVTVNTDLEFTIVALNGNSSASSLLTVKPTDPPADLRNELVAYYRLDTDFANDPAASGADALGVNDPTVGAPGGLVGNALELETSTNQHLNAPLSYGGAASDLGDSFTVSAWYQLNDPATPSGSGRYFVFESSENYDISFGIRDLGIGEPGTNDGQTFTQGGASQGYPDLALAGWHQVLQRYTAIDGITTIETFGDGIFLGAVQNATSNISGLGINFGAPRSTVVDRGFDGLLDEIALWARPLTDEEIALTYELGRGGAGVVDSPAPLVITSLTHEAKTGVTSFVFVSLVGATYAIDRSFDLEIWNEIEDNYQATSELSTFQDAGAGPTAYYRVRRLN